MPKACVKFIKIYNEEISEIVLKDNIQLIKYIPINYVLNNIELCKYIIRNDITLSFLNYFEYLSPELCQLLFDKLEENNSLKNMEIINKLISKDGLSIRFIKNKRIELCITALNNNIEAIHHLEN